MIIKEKLRHQLTIVIFFFISKKILPSLIDVVNFLYYHYLFLFLFLFSGLEEASMGKHTDQEIRSYAAAFLLRGEMLFFIFCFYFSFFSFYF